MLVNVHQFRQLPLGLRWRFAAYVGLGLVGLLVGWLGFGAALGSAWANQWVLVAGLVLAYQVGLVGRGLRLNHRANEQQVLSRLGPGNWLSLLRGLAVAGVAGFIGLERPDGWLAWWPALLYTIACIFDFLDGYLARVSNHATGLGELLDVEMDSLSVLVVVSVAIWWGTLPAIFLLLGVSRYAFVVGQWWLQQRGQPIDDLTPSPTRRIMAGATMGFLSAMLWPSVHPPGSVIAGVAFGLPFAAGFLRDWWIVSGTLKADGPRYQQSMAVIHWLMRWLPVALRGLAVIGVVGLLVTIPGNPNWAAAFAWPAAPNAWLTVTAIPLIVGGVLGALLVLPGVITRLGGFLLIFLSGPQMLNTDLTWANGLVLVCGIWLLLLGGGALALWSPDDRAFTRRAGETTHD